MGSVNKVLFKTLTQVKIKAITILFKTIQKKVSVKETEDYSHELTRP
jgi:non-canonical (house-cleaning) NTP pyrophosphatase